MLTTKTLTIRVSGGGYPGVYWICCTPEHIGSYPTDDIWPRFDDSDPQSIINHDANDDIAILKWQLMIVQSGLIPQKWLQSIVNSI